MRLILPILLILSGSIFAEVVQFRGHVWGSSIADVKKKEKLKLLESDGTLLSDKRIELFGVDCNIIFQFHNGRLFSGGYICQRPQNFLQVYRKMRDKLAEKYGQPMDYVETVWGTEAAQEIYKDDIAGALEAGHCHLQTIWQKDKLTISIMAKNFNFTQTIIIRYDDENIKAEHDADKDNESKSKL